MQINTDKLQVIHQLSIAFLQVRQQKHFMPLFDLIDRTSPATAHHSRGVSVVARTLAEKTGCSNEMCELLALSGMLHDIGKVTIPDPILNKAGSLTNQEKRVMHSHVEMTFGILTAFSVRPSVLRWCAFHHERLNGTGYPFGFDAAVLDKGCRIMSIADVFVALTENRIYREGMPVPEAIQAMSFMVKSGALDGAIFKHLEQDTDRYDEARRLAQRFTYKRTEAA